MLKHYSFTVSTSDIFVNVPDIRYSQKGVGLIEVMVAVLILAVAVLGFSALQMQAVKATDESLIRTQATSIVRGLAENMRANSGELALVAYQSEIAGTTTGAVPTCNSMTNSCSAEQIARKEAKASKTSANAYGVSLGVINCPGTSGFSKIKCVIAAWDDTKAEVGTDADACADVSGVYKTGASCLIVEAY